MTDPGQSASGDYGYDMAHEDMRGRRVPDDRAGPEHPQRPPAKAAAEPDEDMSYDEAHDF
ncbi:MAG TPA: hypothetical protein VIH08_03925 [Blastococcus sp.]